MTMQRGLDSLAHRPSERTSEPPPMVSNLRLGGSARYALSRHVSAMASMVLGTAMVLGLVLAMNAAVPPPKADTAATTSDFTVAKTPPPKKPRPEKPRKVKERKTSASPRAPLPELATAIGGVDFNLPGVQTGDLGAMSQDVLGDANRRTAMTADAVDEPPRARSRVQPEYPGRARERGVQGYVTLKLKVSASGDVETVRVVEANPRGVFESSAIASIKQWQFDPGMYQGAPVDTWVNQTLRFQLN